jgi:hypothetical protein
VAVGGVEEGGAVGDVIADVDVVGIVDGGEGADEMMRVTGMVCGLLTASSPMTVMVPAYVPAARPDRLTIAVKGVGPGADDLPEDGESVSHDTDAVALQSNRPFPMLETSIVWAALVSP